MNRNESIAVFAGLAMITYLFFSGPIMSLFSNTNVNPPTNTTMPQSGVETQDLTVGGGEVAAPGDRITAHYVGQLPNGQVFDSSRDSNTPIQFTLGVGQVIRGWDEGLNGMRVGGKRVLTISPEYAYGDQAVGTIPANSTLIFEVELLGVEKPASN